MWSHLNRFDLPEDDPAYSEARRRVLGRLGEYVAQVIAPLNMRPTAATLLFEDLERIEVRVSTPGRHIVLVIAPDGDLAAELFFVRSLAIRHVPAARLIAHDLSRANVPFGYVLLSYISGMPLERLEDGPLMRVAARQIGRALRQTHSMAAPAYGRPAASGRWSAPAWDAALQSWLTRRAVTSRAQDLLGAEGVAALWAATLEHPALDCQRPVVLHGAVEPGRALVTVGETAQLEALVQPGEIVGGDPLFDLAHALLPQHPAAFRQGVWEGYTATRPLDSIQQERLQRLRLLLSVAHVLERGDDAARARLPEHVAGALREL